MSLTLKQFSNLITAFVESNFLPILQQLNNVQSAKALENWKHVQNLISDVQIIDFKILQNAINSLNSNKGSGIFYAVQNRSSPSQNKVNSSQGLSFLERWHNNSNSKIEDQCNQSRASLGSYNGISSPPNRTVEMLAPPKIQSRIEDNDQQIESIEKLIVSFTKLCTNFQNNHRKLIRQGYQSKYI